MCEVFDVEQKETAPEKVLIVVKSIDVQPPGSWEDVTSRSGKQITLETTITHP